ncbi:MAG TPA: cellulase family glycosylhydrolase [Fibrobacteria bacterium]|nr:cellulase family glycosylhydrolase [Fibrobacteria bacterium]
MAALSIKTFAAAPAASPVDMHGALSVSGNKIVNQHGTPTQLTGMSLFWSGWSGQFYNRKAVSWIAYDWNASVVRAAIGVEGNGNYLDSLNKGDIANLQRADSVIQAAIDNGIYVIIDWHDHYAHNHTAKSVEFFKRMATKWGEYPNVIYEIYNEPMGAQAPTTTNPDGAEAIDWATQIKPYSEEVIAAIRGIDPDNIILVGTPSWAQDVDVVSYDPIDQTVYGGNLAYTLHFYAGSHGAALRNKANTAMNNGLALFISEWGTSNADGGGGTDKKVYTTESDAWLTWAASKKIGWCNWSLTNKAEASAALLPTAGAKGWWADSLLSVSGTYVRSKIREFNGPFGYLYPEPPPGDKPDTASLPGRLQAEGFVAMSGIQSESGADIDGTDNLGYIEAGDWADYAVKVTGPGPFYFHARVASNGVGGDLVLRDEAGTALASVPVVATGGWQKWVTVVDSHSLVNLPTGLVRLRLSFEGTGTRSLYNLNWVELKTEIDPVSVGRPRTVGSWKMLGNELSLSGLDKNWSTVSVRDVRGQLVAQSGLTDGAAKIRLTGKGIFFAEIAGPKAREVRKLLVGN